MTAREMQIEFDTRIQLAVPSTEVIIKPDSTTIFMFLNEAQDKFIKARYTGYNADNVSFEQNQKSTDELKTIVKSANISTIAGTNLNKPNSYTASLPADYKYLLSDEVIFTADDFSGTPFEQRAGITDCTYDTYRSHIEDPYSEHRYHYETAKPLRLISENKVELVTDGNYTINVYYITYLKEPLEISLGVDGNDCELPEDVHQDIVALAVNLYLANISSQINNTNQS